MKRSILILKALAALFIFAVSLALLNASPEIGLVSTAMALPLILTGIETSDEAKQKRHKLWLDMESLIKLRKEEKRLWTADETQKYNQLRSDFDTLTAHIAELESHEKNSLIMAGRAIQSQIAANTGERWRDARTGQEVKVYRNTEHITQHNDTLSFGRLISAMISGSWDGAEGEKRAISTIGTGGSVLVPVGVYSNIIDTARNQAVCSQAGMKTFLMPDSGRMTLVAVDDDLVFQSKAENALFNESPMTFKGINLEAKTLGLFLKISQEMVQDSANLPTALDRLISDALASEIDRLCLVGAGGGEMLGLQNTPGVWAVPTINGDVITYQQLVAGWQAASRSNGKPGAIILHPRDAATLAVSETQLGFLEPPKLIEPLQWLYTSSLPDNLGSNQNQSIAFVGDFSRMMLGIRQSATLEISAAAGDSFQRHQLAIKITFRGDLAIEHPRSFAMLTGLKPDISGQMVP